MATGTSVLKLVVDDKEYGPSIKNAKLGMQALQESLQKAGKSFENIDGKITEYVRAIGQMETTSKSAKGTISEMSAAFVDLSMQYKHMTDQEKQSPAGQALAESLAKLRERTINAKDELSNLNSQLEPVKTTTNETGGVMGMLKDKLTVNIDAMKLFSLGLQAAKAALDVAKDAFFNNEQQLDDWGRTVESSESLYKGFLNALNTGDISGYLQNIDNITRAARAAYDALDALNTFNAFNQINVEKTRTGMTESIASYREGTGTREEVKAAGEAYKKELQERKKLEKEAYIEAVGKVAAERGVSKEDLLTALSGTYGSYQQLKNMPMSGTETRFYGAGMFGGGGSYQVAVPNSVQEKLGDALRRLNDTELQSLQALGAQAERTGNEIASVDKQLTRVLNGRQGGAGGSTGGGGGSRAVNNTETFAADSIAYQEKLVQELTKKWKEAGAAVRDDYAKQLGEAKQTLSEMQGGFAPSNIRDITNAGNPNLTQGAKLTLPVKLEIQSPEEKLREEAKRLTDMLSEAWSDTERKAIKERLNSVNADIDKMEGKDTGRDDKKLNAELSKFTSGLSQVTGGLKQIGIDVPQEVDRAISIIQGLTSVIEGVQTVISLFSTTAMTANTAAIVANTAALTFNSATNFVPLFANGGIVPHAAGGWLVPGNDHADRTLIAASSGELILNRAQQGNLASQLEGGMGNLHVTGKLAGHDLLISIDRTARIEGKGEMVFWHN